MYYMYYYFISQEKSSNERVPFEIQPNRQYFVLKSFCRLNLKQNRTSLNIVGVLFEIHLKETIHQSPHKRGCVFPMVIWPAFRMKSIESMTILTTHPSLFYCSMR